MTGVAARPPSAPRLVIVIVEPVSSSRDAFPSRAAAASRRNSAALCHRLSASEVARIAAGARSGKMSRDELTGSTITITSLGALGGIATTPVINHPEVAIIGVNRIAERPVVHQGQIAIRKMMNLSSSFDHRIVDGWEAAAFIQHVKRWLEYPAMLFVG